MCSWSEFVERATTLLNDLRSIRHEIEKANEGRPASTITHIFNKEKENIVQEILDTAIETRCTTGKVFVFFISHSVPAPSQLLSLSFPALQRRKAGSFWVNVLQLRIVANHLRQ
jgi:hypothetical protein